MRPAGAFLLRGSRRLVSIGLCATVAGSGWGCGYRLAGATDPAGPFAVEGALGGAPYPEAHRGAARGASEELARSAQLASASASRAVVRVEILRVDVRGGAIGFGAGAGQGDPKAGSVRITVTGRGRMGVPDGDGDGMAWLRDTGDVTATDEIAAPPSSEAFILARERSVESTSRRLGQRLVQRLLLLP